MPSLLHIDASAAPETSVSRRLSARFAEQWRIANPGGGYVHRDFAAQPVPHITGITQMAGILPEEQKTDAHRDEWAITSPLIEELKAATTIVIGTPMYNFSIPSTLKAWLDRVIAPTTMVNPETGESPLGDKRLYVVTARGGSYAPGTPRAHFDFQEPYLKAVLSQIGLDRNLRFVHAELTMAAIAPQMAELRPIAEASLAAAFESVEKHASEQEFAAAS